MNSKIFILILLYNILKIYNKIYNIEFYHLVMLSNKVLMIFLL